MDNVQHYDFIITGGGCAGLSMVYQLLQSPLLKNKKILLLDKSPKVNNDRTWCFWEENPGPFEEVVSHQWPRLWMHQGNYSAKLSIAPLSYKMIRGIDFYRFIEKKNSAARQRKPFVS